jgi:ParB/RepB/Spo0J family partition protein
MTIELLDPEKVKDNPFQPRKGYSPKKVEEITSSIEQNGLLSTPLGRRQNGDVELAFGHIRKRAFIKLKKKNPKKWPTMPVEIQEITDQQMAVYALEENLKRSDITPIDLARSVTKYFEVFTDATETDLAKKLSMTQGNVSNMRRVTRLPDEILVKIDEGRITFTMARELLVFEGITAPSKDSRWSQKENKQIEITKDSKWLMLDTIKRVTPPGKETRYGNHPNTVEGMQKAIHDTAASQFKRLGNTSDYGYYHGDEVLFNVEKASCKTCKATIKTHPTKSHVCYWCTNADCWEKKQKKHKEERAAAAKKQMQKDVIEKVVATETERQAQPTISQEIPKQEAPPDIVDTIPKEEREEARKRIKQLKKLDPDYPCLTCLLVGRCEGRGVYAVSGTGEETVHACDDKMTKGQAKEVREKATVKVAPEIMALAKEKVGSRAEVLDLNELRTGYYADLKQGYVLLDELLKTMDKPEECLETCTRGFHYAFDSKERPSWMQDKENKVSYVCTDPKCVTKKKAAYTRALHAAGMAKKKAEATAIKEAVTSTTRLDHSRLKVLVAAFTLEQRYYYSNTVNEIKWFAEQLGIGKKDIQERPGAIDWGKLREKILKHLDSISEEDLAKLVLRFALSRLTYGGDIKDYKIKTTEALNWLGVGINLPKGAKDEAAAGD